MKKYRRKDEVLVWEWTGDKSIIDEINKVIEPYKKTLSIGISTNDEKILYISSQHDIIYTGTSFVRLGEFIIFDVNNDIMDSPLFTCQEGYFNNNYIEI